jgi:hypothetical protein
MALLSAAGHDSSGPQRSLGGWFAILPYQSEAARAPADGKRRAEECRSKTVFD